MLALYASPTSGMKLHAGLADYPGDVFARRRTAWRRSALCCAARAAAGRPASAFMRAQPPCGHWRSRAAGARRRWLPGRATGAHQGPMWRGWQQ